MVSITENSTSFLFPLSYNFSNITGNNQNNTGNVDEDNSLSNINHWLQVIVRPGIIIVGTIGNLLTFYVMRRGSLKNVSTCFYMAVLALADTGLLCGGLVGWVEYLTDYRVNPNAWTDCKLSRFLNLFFPHYSSTLLVIMSIEKCFALYFPFKARSICIVKTAKWVCGITALILVAFNSQVFFLFEFDSRSFCKVSGNTLEKHQLIFFEISTILYLYAPFTIMFLANSAIIYKFLKAKWQSRQNGTESTNQALSKSATKGTATLISVSVTFLILTGPKIFTYAITRRPSNVISDIFSTLIILNHGLNGFLYCIIGSRFRNELIKVLCCRARGLTENESSSSKSLKYVTNDATKSNSSVTSVNPSV